VRKLGISHRAGSIYPAGGDAGSCKADGTGHFPITATGFRPGRSAHQAVKAAQEYIAADTAGWWTLDLEKFFDRVCHDQLMGKIAERVSDKRLLKLIRAFSASRGDGRRAGESGGRGNAQGGPLVALAQ